jgi:hypothetical protein
VEARAVGSGLRRMAGPDGEDLALDRPQAACVAEAGQEAADPDAARSTKPVSFEECS